MSQLGDTTNMRATSLKRLAARLPHPIQQELKRLRYHWQIRRHTFVPPEPEFQFVDSVVGAGDWVIDVGANVGHYAKRFSDLVGAEGRVIAIEPVPETFALLAANVALFPLRNVTLLNVAASNQATVLGIRIPNFETGLANYYQASVTSGQSSLQVMTLALDSLAVPHPIKLVKVDAEGHDPLVLQGIDGILRRDHPGLIVETTSAVALEHLEALGYKSEKLPGSPNTVCRWQS